MTKEELIDYVKDVFELELQIYTYKRIEKEYDEKLTYIGVPRELELTYTKNVDPIPVIRGVGIQRKTKPEWKETQEYRNIIKSTEFKDNSKETSIKLKKSLIKALVIFVLIILFLAFFILGIESLSTLCIIGSILYIIYGFLLKLSIPSSKMNKSAKEFERSRKLDEYYAKCVKKEAQKIVESEKPLRRLIANERVESVIKPRRNTEELLDKLYSKNIIFPKYRNFATIAQIYEYLLSGRCDQLEGPYGAYNLYESELRQNIIIDKLDEIIRQLERLNATMNAMCVAINESNRLLSNISSTLGRIEANTSLMAYNSQCIAHNTRIASQYVL